MRASDSRYGRISAAPRAQLTPTLNGSACATESQNASIVWPESVRPLRSGIVTEDRSGGPGPGALPGGAPGLRVQRVKDRPEQQEVAPAVDEPADLLRVSLGHPVEGDRPVGRLVPAGGQ